MPKPVLYGVIALLLITALLYFRHTPLEEAPLMGDQTIAAVTDQPVETTADFNADDLKVHAQQLASQFVGTLKPLLKKQLTENGPVAAIKVCQLEAPAITQQLAEQSGWEVKRVSLKPRNAKTASADDWESAVLNHFDQQIAESAGNTLEADTVEAGAYRYMRAQVVEPPCLICHGKNIAPEVEATLAANYPADTATGYELGEVRGAISLRKTLTP